MVAKSNPKSTPMIHAFVFALSLFVFQSESAPQAFRRDPGHPQWHHSAFHDVRDGVRSDVRRMLHSRAEVILSISFSTAIGKQIGKSHNFEIRKLGFNF